MDIVKSEFIISAVKKEQYPMDERIDIAFVGRSNVGKSSIINALTNRKSLAKVSGTPGKTRLINFFLINDLFYLVDLPGYGYAKISKSEKAKWGGIIEEYFKNRLNLKKIVLLVDSRHNPTSDDVMMYNFIKYYNFKVDIVATKLDKISKNEIDKSRKRIKSTLNLKDENIYFFSSLKKAGREELIDNIFSF